MTISSEYPEPIAALLRVLAERQFDVVRQSHGSMGGAELVVRGASGEGKSQDVWIEINGDRGHWSIGIRFDERSPWITPAVWEAHLDGREIRPPDIAADARFVERRLDEAAHAVALRPAVEAELARMGREYMRRRLGVLPSDEEDMTPGQR
jgi:hypothetical protein